MALGLLSVHNVSAYPPDAVAKLLASASLALVSGLEYFVHIACLWALSCHPAPGHVNHTYMNIDAMYVCFSEMAMKWV